jgi:hypothetical protein
MNLTLRAIGRGSFALGAVIAALVIVACGSSSGSSSSSSAGGTSSASASASGGRGRFGNPAQRAKLVACLKQHGVTLPSRPPGAGPGSGVPPSGSGSANGAPPAGGFGGGGQGPGFGGGGPAGNPKFRAALQACGANFGTRVSPAARKAQITKFVTCVNQHGYELPKPNLSGKGAVFPAKIQSDPKFQTASRACASLLRPPAGAAGGSGSGAGGSGGGGSGGGGPSASNA